MSFQLILNKKERFTESIYGFWFNANGGTINFNPGQFLDWRLDHKDPDSRGVQRFFTVASSLTERDILLTTKIIKNSSTFKKSLKKLQAGDKIMVEGPYGEFILPEKKEKKIVFIAGGIGITPFRSMIKHLLDIKEKRDIVLFYGVNSTEEIVFGNLFSQVEKDLGIETIYVVKDENSTSKDWQGETGYIDADIIRRHVGNTNDFIFYISGPEPMVHGISDMLIKAGIKQKQLKYDYFPGYEKI